MIYIYNISCGRNPVITFGKQALSTPRAMDTKRAHRGNNTSSHRQFENYQMIFVCSWWRHQMETFSALLAICAGNSPVPGEFPAQRPVTRNFHVSLICAWINRWVNNREAGDLIRYCAHYDVIVMFYARPVLIFGYCHRQCLSVCPSVCV